MGCLESQGFHAYFWTDDQLEISPRCDTGEPVYNVTNLAKRQSTKTSSYSSY